jgi:hypothetical protein
VTSPLIEKDFDPVVDLAFGYEEEHRVLCDLAASIVDRMPQARLDLTPWLDALRMFDPSKLPPLKAEWELARRAGELRRLWLKTSRRWSDRIMKSPPTEQVTATPSGAVIDYGYERDLDPTHLEKRCAQLAGVQAGWTADHVLFSSGQAALAAILLALLAERRRGETLHALFLGNYFETHDLLDLFAHTVVCDRVHDWGACATPELLSRNDLIVIEPVSYGREMRAFDLDRLLNVWVGLGEERPRTLIFDTTLVGPRFPLAKILSGLWRPPTSTPLVVQLRSGLKLDQAGFELANVGIASLYAADNDRRDRAGSFGARLRKVRTTVGSGLTFDEIAVLEAPWFLDAATLSRHTDWVFAHNAALAQALWRADVNVGHSCLNSDQSWAVAPFCTIHLATDEIEVYRALETQIGDEALRRGLLFDRGGSFGFRGHRYEVVEPDPARGAPFLRIAMGARGGPSLCGVIDLMVSLLGELNSGRTRAFEGLALAPPNP